MNAAHLCTSTRPRICLAAFDQAKAAAFALPLYPSTVNGRSSRNNGRVSVEKPGFLFWLFRPQTENVSGLSSATVILPSP